MKTPKKAMTVRLPLDLYRAAAHTASRRRISIRGLVQQSLRDTLAHEKRKQLYEAFSQVAQDRDESDVDFAFDAQTEVVHRGES
jgi:hypothetical protein